MVTHSVEDVHKGDFIDFNFAALVANEMDNLLIINNNIKTLENSIAGR